MASQLPCEDAMGVKAADVTPASMPLRVALVNTHQQQQQQQQAPEEQGGLEGMPLRPPADAVGDKARTAAPGQGRRATRRAAAAAGATAAAATAGQQLGEQPAVEAPLLRQQQQGRGRREQASAPTTAAAAGEAGARPVRHAGKQCLHALLYGTARAAAGEPITMTQHWHASEGAGSSFSVWLWCLFPRAFLPFEKAACWKRMTVFIGHLHSQDAWHTLTAHSQGACTQE